MTDLAHQHSYRPVVCLYVLGVRVSICSWSPHVTSDGLLASRHVITGGDVRTSTEGSRKRRDGHEKRQKDDQGGKNTQHVLIESESQEEHTRQTRCPGTLVVPRARGGIAARVGVAWPREFRRPSQAGLKTDELRKPCSIVAFHADPLLERGSILHRPRIPCVVCVTRCSVPDLNRRCLRSIGSLLSLRSISATRLEHQVERAIHDYKVMYRPPRPGRPVRSHSSRGLA